MWLYNGYGALIISNVPWSRNYLKTRVLLSILTRLIMENLLHDISSQSPIAISEMEVRFKW